MTRVVLRGGVGSVGNASGSGDADVGLSNDSGSGANGAAGGGASGDDGCGSDNGGDGSVNGDSGREDNWGSDTEGNIGEISDCIGVRSHQWWGLWCWW